MKKQLLTVIAAMTLAASCGAKNDSMSVTTATPGSKKVLYVAEVKGDSNISTLTARCAKQIAAVKGVTNIQILGEIGVVTFAATPKLIPQVKALRCVASVAESQEAHANPSTRIGN